MRNIVLYHITKQRKLLPLIAILLTLGTIVWVVISNQCDFGEMNQDNWWIKWFDPVIGLSTFIVAIVIWLMNTAKYWEDSLDKKLSVVYKESGGRTVIQIENAFLAHEGDIRQWGQTLGRQAVGKGKDGRDIYFDINSNIVLEKPVVVKNNSTYFKHYSVLFMLTKLPPENIDGENLEKGMFLWDEGGTKARFIPNENNENGQNTTDNQL